MDIDRHGPRLMPNNCKNLDPPNFSLPTAFKGKNQRERGGQDEAVYCFVLVSVMDVLLSVNFAAIFYKIYFLFRLLQHNYWPSD